jgi:hypothetical protein
VIPSVRERKGSAMNTNERTSKSRNFLNESVRGCLAVALSLLLIPYTQPGLFAQAPPPPGAYAPLGAEQLNQLVAPIALYPDSLVAQILTASTYPQQVSDANNWMTQTAGMPPEQRPAAADQMPWDPSIKALTAFPSVLSNMARNYNWTGSLGNAYYNQPGDVMNAVQAMRMQAQAAGTLRSSPQERVIYDGGTVVIEPVNPAFVYVPYYNPWVVFGAPIVPWGGYYYYGPPRGVVLAGIGIGFGVGISLALFGHYGWGYHNWAPNWHGGVVVYNHTTYISRSTTVYNHGNFGGYNRGVYEHAGPGVPRNFHAPVTGQSAAFHGAGSAGFRGSSYAGGHATGTQASPGGRQFGQPSQPSRTPASQGAAGGRQFGQSGQTSHSPTSGGATPHQPAGASPAYRSPGGAGNTAHTPQSSTPAHQPAGPSQSHSVAATPSHQPAGGSHQSSGGGGQHPSGGGGGQHPSSGGSATKHK